MNERPTLYLIDGSAYIYRAFHAIKSLSNSKGLPTNAVFGFTKMLLKLLEDRKPVYAAMLFDAKGPTFRHELYDQYKANRPPMPEELSVQIPYIKDITQGMNIPMFEMSGMEADDLIGTLARQAEQAGFSVVMVTGDKDFMQLVTENILMWDPMKDKETDVETVRENFGVAPEQIVDIMGLAGDTSDNVPGVPGIGLKTASKLIQDFGSMDQLYARVEEITKKKQKENLIQYKDQALLSRKLVTIDIAAPVPFDAENLKVLPPDSEKLSALFKTLEFRQLQKDFPQHSDLSKKAYRVITDMTPLENLVTTLRQAGCFAVDTETTSVDPMTAELVGLSFSHEAGQGVYIPVGHRGADQPVQLDWSAVRECIKPLLEDPDIQKVGQNIKYDWIVLARHGVQLQGHLFDTMLASYVLHPSKRAHNLDQIALDFLDHRMIAFEEVVDKTMADFSEVPLDKAVMYSCEDADITLAAHDIFLPLLKESGTLPLFETVEMPLVPVLVKMEMRGICVDKDKLTNLSKTFAQRLDVIEKDIYASAGEQFNIKSSQQLGTILFEKLGLPVQKKTKKKTAYSTDVEVLSQLSAFHELPALVLKHRTLSKLKSTYTDALLDLIHPETGRIHTSYNQTVTATGRLSSSDPNLQNIPIRDEEGREIRRTFIPQKGWHLVSADYSQIELRILAHYSADPILIEAFRNDEDIHLRTAAEVFQLLPNFITADIRRQAKAINFGIVYGMSAFGLSKALGISQKMANTYITSYFKRYKGVKDFIDRTIEETRKTQRTSTLLGRIRLLPEIAAANGNQRQFAERIAINTPIQGTAADLIKLAMIKVDETFVRERLNASLLLSVHDELVCEAPPDEIETVQRLMREVMEGIWDLKVPLKVNIQSGENWAEAH